MRAGVNAIFLEPGMGGMQTYILELMPALLRAEPALDLTLLVNEQGRELVAAQPWAGDLRVSVPPVFTRRGLRGVGELTALGPYASRHFDVLCSTALTGPLVTRAAHVVVLADVTWLTVPDLGKGQAATVRLWQLAVPHVARRADRVIAISEASAHDVVEHLRVPRERIDVVPLGYGARQRPEPAPAAQLRAKLGLADGPLLLNIAMKKRHKNVASVIEALPVVRAAVPGTQLVLPGASSPYEAELRALAHRLGLEHDVVFPGYLSDAEIEGLYATADVFVFPSLNEGFGLPLLEAMARGLPIVTSNISAMPEVAGDAALLVDPHSADQIAQAVIRILREDALREHLVAAGRERVGEYTWERVARGTLASWERARR
jgi:glycosyltransferase involved in cell wall biosynthesis